MGSSCSDPEHDCGEEPEELREDPRVYMTGECGSGRGYQMTLPPELEEFHIDITLEPDASFELRGRFVEQ